MTDSKTYPPVDCPLCFHQDLWNGSAICPGCHRKPEEILESGAVGQISRFKLPGLYALFPGLARVDTQRELCAVRLEDENKGERGP